MAPVWAGGTAAHLATHSHHVLAAPHQGWGEMAKLPGEILVQQQHPHKTSQRIVRMARAPPENWLNKSSRMLALSSLRLAVRAMPA